MEKEIQAQNKAKVILSKDLIFQIAHLHKECPKDKEWSGLLVWKIQNGGIDDFESYESSVENTYCFYESLALKAIYGDSIVEAIEVRKVLYSLPFELGDLIRRIDGKIGNSFKLDEDGGV